MKYAFSVILILCLLLVTSCDKDDHIPLHIDSEDVKSMNCEEIPVFKVEPLDENDIWMEDEKQKEKTEKILLERGNSSREGL